MQHRSLNLSLARLVNFYLDNRSQVIGECATLPEIASVFLPLESEVWAEAIH